MSPFFVSAVARAADSLTISMLPGDSGVVSCHAGRVYVGGTQLQATCAQLVSLKVVGTVGDDVIDLAGVSHGEFPLLTAVNIKGGDGSDHIVGSPFNDIIDGNLGNDTILAGGGADEVRAGGGADEVRGEGGGDRLFGNGGDDRLYGAGSASPIADAPNSLYGGDGNDRIIGGSATDQIQGNAGNDRAAGNGGADDISGGAGGDTLAGGSDIAGDPDDNAVDLIAGNEGDDLVLGQDADIYQDADPTIGNDLVKWQFTATGSTQIGQIAMADRAELATRVAGTWTVIEGSDCSCLAVREQRTNPAGLKGRADVVATELSFKLSGGDDKVQITMPLLTSGLTVNGAGGVDSLKVFVVGNLADVVDTGSQITFPGSKPITYSGFESVKIVTR